LIADLEEGNGSYRGIRRALVDGYGWGRGGVKIRGRREERTCERRGKRVNGVDQRIGGFVEEIGEYESTLSSTKVNKWPPCMRKEDLSESRERGEL
jgi:hypothetical protein